jgi:hypothetical protein
LSRPSLIHDPNAGEDVEANLDFAADGLTIFNRAGRKLQHWPYDEIIHAFAAGAGPVEVLAHSSRPEIHLQVPDDPVYRATRERAPQLRPPQVGLRSFLRTMDGMPQDAKLGLVLLAGFVSFTIYSLAAGWFE